MKSEVNFKPLLPADIFKCILADCESERMYIVYQDTHKRHTSLQHYLIANSFDPMSVCVCRQSAGYQSPTEVVAALGVLRRDRFLIRLTVVQPLDGKSSIEFIYLCQHDNNGVDRRSLIAMLEEVLGPREENGRCVDHNISCILG